jgi:hypothetical protein
MKLSSRAYNLFQVFTLPGCPVCRLTLDSVHHYLDSLIYEYVNEPDTHFAVRAARGFCPTHAWHIQDELNASALGIAVLYEGLIRNMLREMGDPNAHGGKKEVAQALDAMTPKAGCPACAHQTTIEDHLIRSVLDHLNQEEFAAAFRQSAGLCMPHLRLALTHKEGRPSAKAHLIALQQEIWGRLQRDLEEFIEKHDYHRADESMGEEGSSPRRSIEQMAGAKGLT